MQEALIRAWQRWSTYDECRGTPVAWLLGILADRCRRHRTRSTGPVVSLVERDAHEDPTPPARPRPRARVGRLTARQRTAVELHYFVGLDVATVARS